MYLFVRILCMLCRYLCFFLVPTCFNTYKKKKVLPLNILTTMALNMRTRKFSCIMKLISSDTRSNISL